METEVKLTKLAGCAGCGAKVGAGTLVHLLEGFRTHTDPRLIVGYDKSDSAALVSASGAIGIIIPPSITFVIYGSITGKSVGELFASGIIPGILMGVLLILAMMFTYRGR